MRIGVLMRGPLLQLRPLQVRSISGISIGEGVGEVECGTDWTKRTFLCFIRCQQWLHIHLPVVDIMLLFGHTSKEKDIRVCVFR